MGRNTLTTAQFIARARRRHGDRFDYSSTRYTGSRELLTIICRSHGPFHQVAAEHIRMGYCPRCHRARVHPKAALIKALEAAFINHMESRQ